MLGPLGHPVQNCVRLAHNQEHAPVLLHNMAVQPVPVLCLSPRTATHKDVQHGIPGGHLAPAHALQELITAPRREVEPVTQCLNLTHTLVLETPPPVLPVTVLKLTVVGVIGTAGTVTAPRMPLQAPKCAAERAIVQHLNMAALHVQEIIALLPHVTVCNP